MCKHSISIIIPIQHKIKKLPRILEACEQLQPLEIILTINGYTQDSIGSADFYNCEIITLEEPIESPNLYVIGAKSKGAVSLIFR